jgi:hypothetical protein
VTFSKASSQAFVKALGDKSRGVSVTQVVPHPGNPGDSSGTRIPPSHQGGGGTDQLVRRAGRLHQRQGAGRRPASRRQQSTRDKSVDALDHMGAINVGDFSVGYTPGDHRGSKFVCCTS